MEDVPSKESIQVRTKRIMGQEGLDALSAARVCVFGVGGVGSNCCEALVRAGVGHLVVVDGDEVDPSNLNRQAIAFVSTIGKRKVEVMAAMAAEMNPYVTVETIDTFVTPENLEEVLAAVGEVDFIVDAIDTVSTKLALAKWCEEHGVRFIAAMGGGNKLHPECVELTDISKTKNCPLCRVMRKECKKQGIRHLRVAYSSEIPVKVLVDDPDATRKQRLNLGTVSFVPAVVGHVIAGDVIRTLAGLDA
jgi:tRNA A37 threonylcarbamoyladenosine dehydratase